MSAALTQAMVTAAMPLARRAPASAQGEKQEYAHVTLDALARSTHAKQPQVASEAHAHLVRVLVPVKEMDPSSKCQPLSLKLW